MRSWHSAGGRSGEVLSPYSLKLLCLSPAQFIHFGTTRELLRLVTDEIDNYEFLDWKRQILGVEEAGESFCACSNSYIERGHEGGRLFLYRRQLYLQRLVRGRALRGFRGDAARGEHPGSHGPAWPEAKGRKLRGPRLWGERQSQGDIGGGRGLFKRHPGKLS